MAAKTAGTWRAYDRIGVGALTDIDTTKSWPLGTKVKAFDVGSTGYGYGEFIYLSGVTSCARGSLVLITDAWGTTLLAARDKGAVAASLGAVDASTKYGWFQVFGQGVALCDTTSANTPLYIDGTSGRCDDAAVAGDCILGMRAVSGDDTSTLVFNMSCHPSVGDFDNA